MHGSVTDTGDEVLIFDVGLVLGKEARVSINICVKIRQVDGLAARKVRLPCMLGITIGPEFLRHIKTQISLLGTPCFLSPPSPTSQYGAFLRSFLGCPRHSRRFHPNSLLTWHHHCSAHQEVQRWNHLCQTACRTRRCSTLPIQRAPQIGQWT